MFLIDKGYLSYRAMRVIVGGMLQVLRRLVSSVHSKKCRTQRKISISQWGSWRHEGSEEVGVGELDIIYAKACEQHFCFPKKLIGCECQEVGVLLKAANVLVERRFFYW